MFLKLLGHEVCTASDGQEGIEAAAKFLPNVVLMDIGMPRMNGYEAAQYIREQSWGQRILLIAVTGRDQNEDRRQSQEAGFDHHLVKPTDASELQRLIQESQVSVPDARER
jgi:CheY-like chemotaxis protein